MDTKEGDGVSWETGTNTHTLSALYIKETTNENLLQSTGTSAQRPVVTRMGRRSEGKGYMRVDGKEVRGEGVYVRGWKGRRRGRDICAWMGRRSEGKGYMRVDGKGCMRVRLVHLSAETNTTWQRSHTQKSILIVLM